jgi:CRISPR/Cas system-associated exonuclease Cas4 (RecB family)
MHNPPKTPKKNKQTTTDDTDKSDGNNSNGGNKQGKSKTLTTGKQFVISSAQKKAIQQISLRRGLSETETQKRVFDIPVPVIGAIDLVEEDEAGTIIITDFKTSKRSYSASEIDSNMQMTLYQLAAKSNGYAEDRDIILKFDTLIKTLKPKCQSYYTVRTEVDEKRLIKKIRYVWDAISKEIYIPNDCSWKCKTCQYRQHCDQWFLEEERK